jgi:NEDD8-activating enzyme E1 regulatory subunit
MATTDKYDRQLRLWGSKGQRALSESTVVLIRATAAGTETLKNLVLPGVGRIIILDDAWVTPLNSSDIHTSNFFLDPRQKDPVTRAQVTLNLLKELNPDVGGSYHHVTDLRAVNYVEFFSSCFGAKNNNFSELIKDSSSLLVIASDLEPPLLDQIIKDCPSPLIQVHSYGLLGIVRLHVPYPLCIFDPKPASNTPDLRLVTPFPALKEFCNSITLDALTDHEHSHIPYPLILLKLQQQWKDSHQNILPSNSVEKQEFRSSIQQASRRWDMQLNFQEAHQNSYLAYTEKSLDKNHVMQLIEKLENNEISNTHYYFPRLRHSISLLKALLKFMDQNSGRAPLGGTLPDMTASTQLYVQLQQIYHHQAQKDISELKSYLLIEDVSDEDVSSFCANVFHLDVVLFRSYEPNENEKMPTDLIVDDSLELYDDAPEHTPLFWYNGWKACGQFYRIFGRYPGVLDNDEWESDIPALHDLLPPMDGSHDKTGGVTMTHRQAMATELTRYANAELHVIASVVGGVASQEAVKLITGQYKPMNNTYVYNGIVSVGAVYEI